MHEYVGAGDRVFRVEIVPGGEAHGSRLRTLTVTLESGPPFTEGEERRVMEKFIAGVVALGADVVAWEIGEDYWTAASPGCDPT